MFEHCQYRGEVIARVAHLIERIVRGSGALRELEEDETATFRDHAIEGLHGMRTGEHVGEQLWQPDRKRDRRPFRFNDHDPQLLAHNEDVDLVLNGHLCIGNGKLDRDLGLYGKRREKKIGQRQQRRQNDYLHGVF
jgi:hypothetical protein